MPRVFACAVRKHAKVVTVEGGNDGRESVFSIDSGCLRCLNEAVVGVRGSSLGYAVQRESGGWIQSNEPT